MYCRSAVSFTPAIKGYSSEPEPKGLAFPPLPFPFPFPLLSDDEPTTALLVPTTDAVVALLSTEPAEVFWLISSLIFGFEGNLDDEEDGKVNLKKTGRW